MEEAKVVRYEHHGTMVSVFEHLKGTHREHCLCFANCAFFKPNDPNNCPIAQANYEFCIKHSLTLPVFECAKYERANAILVPAVAEKN